MPDGPDRDGSAKATPPDVELHLSAEQLKQLPQKASLETTLFDIAKHSLADRSKLSGEPTDKNNVYHELNRIMVLNNYTGANLGAKSDISDKDLPRTWNNVRSHQEFKLYDGKTDVTVSSAADKTAEALRDKLRRQIEDETSTVPVQRGEGYYQVWQRMHPELTDDQVNRDAHRIKHINGDRDVLRVGERLATATPQERAAELEKRLQAAQEKERERQAQTPPAQGKPEQNLPANTTPEKKPPVQTPPADSTQGPKQPPTGSANVPPVANPGKIPPAADPTKVPPADKGPDLTAVYEALRIQHVNAARLQDNAEKGQGFIGRAFDDAKNSIGSSGSEKDAFWHGFSPGKIWSNLFDSDLGSKAIDGRLHAEEEKLGRLKQAAEAHDTAKFGAVYKELTGREYNVNDLRAPSLDGAVAANSFDHSQHNGVDAISDIGVALAVAATLRAGKGNLTQTLLRGMGTGAVVGGASKAGLMQLDGHYANLGHDLSTGALMGATVPIGELGGAQLSRSLGTKMGLSVTGDLLTARIETQGASIGTKFLSAAAKSGTSGAIFGAVESPGREVINDLEQGREIHISDLAATSLKGSVFGFLGGTALGASMDGITNGFRTLRPGPLTNVKHTVGGVEAPTSGAVSLDDAAKILKMDAADLAQTAADKPYSAVSKAVKLYEKTGLNIRKTDPLSGEGVLPKPFEEALTTVQHVDVLTAESKLKLSGKVKVVEATDTYLKANPAAVDEPMARVRADANYQEVVKLKTAEGGQPAADAFEQQFQQGFAKDLKTTMSVHQVKTDGLKPADALATAQPEMEAAYKQKAADYFKDMTDPAQRERLNFLVDEIYGKFNPETLKKGDIEAILQDVPAADRELAVALMHESAGTASDVGLKARFQALKSDISAQVGSSAPNDVYTLAPNSSANLLGYLYRKSNSVSMQMHNIDNLAASVQSGHPPHSVVLFDDLSSTPISQANLDVLKKVPNVYVVDVGAFEKAINVIDVSKGPQAVAEKLNTLLGEARKVQAANPGMLATGVARQTLVGSVDEAAKAIGPNVKIIRPSTSLQVPNAVSAGDLAKMTDVDAIHSQYNVPKASTDQIASFLTGYVGEEREMAARMLADGAVHNSFPAMVQKAVDLHSKLTDMLGKSGVNMRDLLVVSDKDPGGSTHLVSYLFGKVNGLSSENFVSTQRLNKLISAGQVKDKAIAYFDDTIYSGSQTTGMLDGNVSSLMPFKKVVIASLGAYDKGIKSIQGTHLASLGKVDVASSTLHQPFYSEAHPFYSQLGMSQRSMVKNIGGSEGFGSVQGSLIWSYMYPDNNLSFFGSKFSGSVLRLPGP